MKKIFKLLGIIPFIAVIGFTMFACNKSRGSSNNSDSDSSNSSRGEGKILNNPEALKEYLDSQPTNSPNNPIKVTMSINKLMIPKIKEVLTTTGKYVNLNLTGNALKEIPDNAFSECKTLVGIIIPNSVTRIETDAFSCCTSLTSITIPNSVTIIGVGAFFYCIELNNVTIPDSVTYLVGTSFLNCPKLTSVTFQGTITYLGNSHSAFLGDLDKKYSEGGIGTYTTTAPVNEDSKWTKQ